MRVWLITIGEPLPTDGGNVRLLRTGIVAGMLAARGHDVVWWTSTMNRTLKSQRFEEDTDIKVEENLQIKLLYAASYRKNISFQRIIYHAGVARKFRMASRREPKPDVIVCSLPTLELCHEATDYGQQQDVPVILDVRDLWPDIFVHLAPRWAHGIARAALAPMYRSAHRSCSRAAAIIGITPEIVDWGLGLALRPKTPLDRDFPLAYMHREPDETARTQAFAFWEKQGVSLDSPAFVACFFGTLNHSFDMQPVLEAARRLKTGGRSFRFILCGDGKQLQNYRTQMADCPHVLFPGWIGAPEIWALMRLASVGLAPYINRFDFAASLPNKSIEYLSAGLPVVTGLQTGVLKNLLETEQCGFVYQDAAALETLLCALYDQPERLNRAASNAHRIYVERFVGEQVYSELCDYLETVAQHSRTSDAVVQSEERTRRSESEEARI